MLTVQVRWRQDVPWRTIRQTLNPQFALALAWEEAAHGFESRILDDQDVRWTSQPSRKQPGSEQGELRKAESA